MLGFHSGEKVAPCSTPRVYEFFLFFQKSVPPDAVFIRKRALPGVLGLFPFTSELSLETATFSTLRFNLKGLPIFLNA